MNRFEQFFLGAHLLYHPGCTQYVELRTEEELADLQHKIEQQVLIEDIKDMLNKIEYKIQSSIV